MKSVKRRRKVSAKAKLNNFDIQVSADITGKNLVPSELIEVQRKLRFELSRVIAKLPYAEAYPHEIRVR